MQSEQRWLFPNVILNNRIRSPSYTASIVGDVFEVITQALLGGTRIHGDGSADGMYANAERLWEVKAAQTRHYFKVNSDQAERLLGSKTIQTDYILWAYEWPREKGGLTAHCKTVRDLIKFVNSNITIVHHFPEESMKKLLAKDEVVKREYVSWRNTQGMPYRVFQVPHFVLDSTRWNCAFPQTTKLIRVKYEYCGDVFETGLFTLVEHKAKTVEPKGGIPF